MKKILLFSILLHFFFPLLGAGEGKVPVSSGAKKESSSSLQKPLKKTAPPSPAAPKSVEGSFCENLPKVIRSLAGNPAIAKLWKEELEKDPHAFLKRFLETEKSGIRVLKTPPVIEPYSRKTAPHLFFCRECSRNFSSPPILHGHRIRNDILLIRIHKWDHASYANIGKLLKMNDTKFSFILWDLRECRGDSPVSVKNILSHLKKYKVPSALLLSRRTRGSAELFAKVLRHTGKTTLSAGEKTAGLPFLMERKNGSFLLAPSGKKVDYLLLIPRIPPFFRSYDCAPVRPELIFKDVFPQGKKDTALHRLCDLMLAKSILAKGGK